ncbi:hypothetical protein DFJ58DRAFT_777993, partial [Suillus subalutaceus]|uniref:uncharacterized protein n=1 Tax=Suillus subalutaceus TaxID=48586 RepID=UPI001B8745FF
WHKMQTCLCILWSNCSPGIMPTIILLAMRAPFESVLASTKEYGRAAIVTVQKTPRRVEPVRLIASDAKQLLRLLFSTSACI